ncbi:bifunctional glucose-1-phosphatase/inositol phosphatase [Erwinia amylovora]|nr:bifunctional glucose-1-phosphatase/inositol phosphatase [Erwinia amylovora]MBZ2387899.1 bifunctional glucose-1-phosphatase/inositol phosphatase [Erwinia amylovora]MCK8155253.1 bifunctional glucose-1-phosphatase/inositol phosphatase [Erwinia amylovora]MCK8159026.1 bifunctional glucose-1-phosphatase/inositol phosphatase [Erwinia amylovora]MCK8165821.1 bifunctional glucose-1-phosphatase/inositol phosphatase [Erwinia amylovora]MCK8172477.1 bifunctional glucose-1-phosphatase/inositol phosphatase
MIKKFSLCALAVFSAFSGISARAAESDYQLEQVLMMSRHNLRAPLADNGSLLDQATQKAWPKWDVPGGQLTTKGGVLEVYMGRYTREWLEQQGLTKQGECPGSDAIHAYANSLQRTVATAQFFITGAFPGCDISVSHQDAMGSMDPIFSPAITNGSEEFNKQALTAINSKSEKLALKPAFQRLEKIINYKNSPACSGKKSCDLTSDNQNIFTADNGKEPGVSGPLKVGNALVDAFTLQYYQGLPVEQVAWGLVKTPDQWQELAAIKNGYQDTLFASPVVAREVAAPLVDYIRSVLVDQDKATAPKVTLMVGHDSNIASLLGALDFKPYKLPGQNEQTPIGGMVQFQRWHDKKNDRELVKVEYVYQTSWQLRDEQPLSLSNPPQRVTLHMAGCPTDANGFCSWERFTRVLNESLQGTPLQVSESARAEPAASGHDTNSADSDTAVNKALAAKAAEDRVATEKAIADKAAAENAAEAQAAAEKATAEKEAADKAAAEKAAAEKAAADKAALEKAAAEKAAADKAAVEKAATDKAAAAKTALERAAAGTVVPRQRPQDKAEAEKTAAEKAALEKAAAGTALPGRAAQDKAEADKGKAEKQQADSAADVSAATSAQ